jgi:hypothetical protein
VKFTATDVFGNTVTGESVAWNHVEKRHKEMIGREDQVRGAIEQPTSVHKGNTPDTMVFNGEPFAAGFWRGYSTIAVVEYTKNNTGYLRTAYLSNREPRGARIWR